MRTTIVIDPDVEAEIDRLRREKGMGMSQALNELARRGMRQETREPVDLVTHDLGLRVDISNVAEALEATEGTTWR